MLAFAHIQKTAGTTLKHILRRSFGPHHCDVLVWPREPRGRIATPDDLRRTRWIYPRLASISGHPIVPFGPLSEACRDLRFYTFLREPLARAVSHYVDFKTRGEDTSLKEYLRHSDRNNWQCRKLCGRASADEAAEVLHPRVFFVGLVEHFDESLVLLRHFADDVRLDIRYRRANTSRKPALNKQLLEDVDSRNLLSEANDEDLKLYRHVVEHVYPRQQVEYGPHLAQHVADLRDANRTYRPRSNLLGTAVRLCLYKPLLPLCSRGAQPAEAA
jgi:hypothetical protein